MSSLVGSLYSQSFCVLFDIDNVNNFISESNDARTII